ncbi:MAG TPA: SDR family oxidoreductase [Pyrinomonadaceae bacterium]|jgi:acyl transferase domain-containing protein
MSDQGGVDYLSGSEIAIVGMCGRFPGAKSVAEFWENLRDGVESLSVFTDQELRDAGVEPDSLNDPNYVKAGMVLEDADLFDAAFFGYSPREAEVMDPQHRLFLECAWEALETAGYSADLYRGVIGVYAGVGTPTYLLHNILSNFGVAQSAGQAQISMGNGVDFLTTRVSYKLNLKGPSHLLQSACSTSLVAIHHACQSLLSGECDIALAGGVSVNSRQKLGYLYKEGGISSPDGHCRAFDAQAQGTVGGSGVGVVVLKSLVNALQDGDRIEAVIKGSAINNDGSRKVGFTAPSVEGQAEVIAEAMAMAGVEPETINYVEAHGTATPLGDPIEIAALTKAFRTGTEKKIFCALGSLKTNVGHLDAAAGVAGIIKAALALKHKSLPPSLHYRRPNPKIEFEDSPFYVNTSLARWVKGSAPRRAGVSSFGIGGTNAHVILEEAPPQRASGPSRSWQLLTISAKTANSLEAATSNLGDFLRRHTEADLPDVAYTLNVGRKAFGERRVVVCRDAEEAAGALSTQDRDQVFTARPREDGSAPLAFMFTGQGSQYVNMARGLYDEEPAFREQVDLCSEALRPHLGFDLRKVLFPVEEMAQEVAAQLDRTDVTQPALFVVEYSLARLLMSWGLRPEAMIGHSIGEYVAACLSGVFSLEDALSLVAGRGRLMQDLPGGAMLSIPLPEEETRTLLADGLSLAAVNGPSACVVSGASEAVERLESRLAGRGVTPHRLRTSLAFHSEMVEPIRDEFVERVSGVTLNPPQIPYVSNVTGTWISEEEATSPHYWAEHMRRPVLFARGIRTLSDAPGRILLEIGPGQTLRTLARQNLGGAASAEVLSSLRHPHDRQSDVALLLKTVGKLWLQGARVDWDAFYAREQRQRVALPTYPFERQRYWVEPRTPAQHRRSPEVRPVKRADIADWFYSPSWKRAQRLAAAFDPQPEAGQKKTWLVFAGKCHLASLVMSQLAQQGQSVVSVAAGEEYGRTDDRAYTVNPRESGDYDALFKELAARSLTPHHVLHLWGVEPADDSDPGRDSFEKVWHAGFYSLIFLARSHARTNPARPLQVLVASSEMQEVTGVEPACPEKATVLGPCKVIPQEYPNITCRSVDLILPQPGSRLEGQVAGQLLAELTPQAGEHVIAYRGTHRWVQHFEPVRLDANGERPSLLRDEGVYLITGGLGRIALELAAHLGQTLRAKVALVGRRGLPPREEWPQWLASRGAEDEVSHRIRKVQAVEEKGGEVLILQADVGDEKQMAAAVRDTQSRFGHIHGVIHAAGAHRQQLTSIQELGVCESEGHFQAKVYGLSVLEKVLRDIPLDFCLLFSSLSSVLGGLGFAAYSAANLFMDAFAHKHNRASSVPWVSVNWDGWQIKKVDEQPAAHSPAIAGMTMTPEEGFEALRRILRPSDSTQLIVSTADLHARLEQWIKLSSVRNAEAAAAPPASPPHERPELQNAFVAPRTETEQTIAGLWRTLLGLERVGVHDNFFELGGHSLLGVQLTSRLRQDFRLEVPLRALFETPTVAGLALLIENRLETDRMAEAGPTPIERREGRTMDQLLAELEQETDEPVATPQRGPQSRG